MLQFTTAVVDAAAAAAATVWLGCRWCGKWMMRWCERKQFPISIIYWKIDYYIENNFLLVKWTTILGSFNIIQSCHLTQSFRQQLNRKVWPRHSFSLPLSPFFLWNRIFDISTIWTITKLKLYLIIFLQWQCFSTDNNLKFCTFLWIGFQCGKQFTKHEHAISIKYSQ